MNRADAERLVAKLDNLEACCRDVEVGITRIRRELQGAFKVVTRDYNPNATQATADAGVTSARAELEDD